VSDYLVRWLRDVVEPFAKPKTTDTYTRNIRLYVSPCLGEQRLDQLSLADIRRWLRQLTAACQCCAQPGQGRRPTRQAAPLLRAGPVLRAAAVTSPDRRCPRHPPGPPWPRQSPAGW
jgi:hypothetical protein